MARSTKTQLKVIQYAQEDEGFWLWMGRYFASAQLKRELGVAMSSDPAHVWFLAFLDHELVGFAAIIPAAATTLRYVYALPAFRDRGVESALIAQGTAWANNTNCSLIHATIRLEEFGWYESFGFEKIGFRGQFLKLVLKLKKEEIK